MKDMTSAEKERRLKFLRKAHQNYGYSMLAAAEGCAQWQEVTGKLLRAENRPGSEEKFADSKKWRHLLRELQKR